jgi:hypothetical protein
MNCPGTDDRGRAPTNRDNPWIYPAQDVTPYVAPDVVDGEVIEIREGEQSPAALRSGRGEVGPLGAGWGLGSWSGPVYGWLPGCGPDSVDPAWWWLGCHGGAGVSTLASLITGGADAARAWPDPGFGGPARVVLVARGDVHGLRTALHAVRQWAAHEVPPVELFGVVVVADAPGRLEPEQNEQLARLRAGAGAVWLIPWIEELRIRAPHALRRTPVALTRLTADLAALASPYSRETSCY